MFKQKTEITDTKVIFIKNLLIEIISNFVKNKK